MFDGEAAADVSDAERAVIQLKASVKALRSTEALARLVLRAEALSLSRIEGLERNLASIADDTALGKPSRPVSFPR